MDSGIDTGLGVLLLADRSAMGCLFERRTWLGDGATELGPEAECNAGTAVGKPSPLTPEEEAGE